MPTLEQIIAGKADIPIGTSRVKPTVSETPPIAGPSTQEVISGQVISGTDKAVDNDPAYYGDPWARRMGLPVKRNLFQKIGDASEEYGESYRQYYAPEADDNFLTRSGKALARGYSSAVEGLGPEGRKDFWTPAEQGLSKGLVAGGRDLGELAVKGLAVLGGLVESRIENPEFELQMKRKPGGPRGSSQGFEDPSLGTGRVERAVNLGERVQAQTTRVNELAARITKVNLAPENASEQAMMDVLAIMPDAVTAAGDTVYEKTGSALAGAGTQALGTLLLFKPGIASKIFRGGKPGSPSANAMRSTFDQFAMDDPAAAKALADHMREADPELAKLMDARIVQAQKLNPETLGAEMVKDQLATAADPVKAAGNGLSQTIGDMLAELDLPKDVPPPVHLTERPAVERAPTAPTKVPVVEPGGSSVRPEAKKARVQAAIARAPAKGMVVIRTGPKEWTIFQDKKPISSYGDEKTARTDAYAAVNPEAFSDPPPLSKTNLAESGIKLPKSVDAKLKTYYEEIIQNINPEALGPKAQKGAAALAKNIAIQMQSDAWFHGQSVERASFWRKNASVTKQFLDNFRPGWTFKDPKFKAIAASYTKWIGEITARDKALGLNYDPIDNALYHLFDDGAAVEQFFTQKYGKKWHDPAFTQGKFFELYKEAVNANFKPKYTNPEEIMLARQHASDVAQMKVQTLRDFEQLYGIAKKITPTDKKPPIYPSKPWLSPEKTLNGKPVWYYVANDAYQILHNAFETKSLWSAKGIGGDIFKSAMFLKNTAVSAALSLSLFHPIHVMTIDNATAMVRATKELLNGTVGAVQFVKNMAKAGIYTELGKETGGQLGALFGGQPKGGYRLLKAYQGKLDTAQLTAADRLSLNYMTEGGMIPELSVQYRSGAISNFKRALEDTVNQKSVIATGKATFYLPFAALQALSVPFFQIWIPSLKIASYLRDVHTAVKVDPSLVTDTAKRLITFRRLAKSVDNRYGEMAYNTLFWNKWVKDIGVASTLSLGWNLGFLREYGGGTIDLVRATAKLSDVPRKLKAGELDRAMFVTYYSVQALAYGGLMTYLLGGVVPTKLIDYVYPQVGKDPQNPESEPERANTMFYPREFYSIGKHIQHEGLASGLTHAVANKAAPSISMVYEWSTGLNYYGQEIRDPNGPFFKKLEQTIVNSLPDHLTPISIQSIMQTDRSAKNIALGVAGFSKAPKYITDTNTQAGIKDAYRRYVAPKATPYEKAFLSNDMRELRRLDAANAPDKDFDTLVDKMVDHYELTDIDEAKLMKQLTKREVTDDPNASLKEMFKRLDWHIQRQLLDKMTSDERDEFLPMSDKTHLRYGYEAPEEKSK